MSWVKVLRAEELAPGQTRLVWVGDERVLVCRVAPHEVYAVEDCCSHDDGPLGQGALDGRIIECPRHGAQFDVRTGEAKRMPAAAPIATFAARLSPAGWIEVSVEQGS